MNGVPAHDLQQATLASIGMVFGQIASVSEVDQRLRASLATSGHRPEG